MMRVALMSVALFGCAHSGGAQKEPPLPKDLPSYGAEQAVRGPDVRVATLTNGLTVWSVARPGLPKAALVLATIGGRSTDPAKLPGLSAALVATIPQSTRPMSENRGGQEFHWTRGEWTVTADTE